MDKTSKFNSCALCLRIIKHFGFYNQLKKSKIKLINILSKDYNRIISILNQDPYDKLFLDTMGIKDNYLYIDITKNEKLIGFLLFYRTIKKREIVITKDILKKVYKTFVNG